MSKPDDIPMLPDMPWTSGKIYQWSDDKWWMLNESSHPEKYMGALPELLKNAPNGYFNNLFCMLLIAQDIFAQQISALNITLSEQTDAFGKPKQGVIQSSNFVEGVSGFRIKFNGDAEFNNAIFRGRIEATSGFFHGELTAGGNSSFQGISIEAGPLQVKPAGTVYSLSYNAGTSISTIMNDIASRTGQSPLDVSISIKNGLYDNKNITHISGRRDIFQSPFDGSIIIMYLLFIIPESGLFIVEGNNNSTLSKPLSFSFEYGDVVFKLINLPVSDPHIAGVVWRDGTNLKISLG